MWSHLILLPFIAYATFLPYFPRDLNILVNIEIKGCSNVGMTEQYTYCLVVTVAFNAACCKAVAQSVSVEVCRDAS